MKKISTSSSGIFTIKEYEMEEGQDFVSLVKQLCAGPEPVQEIIPYVFEGDDPLGIDANPVSAGDFIKMYPGLKGYGEDLADASFPNEITDSYTVVDCLKKEEDGSKETYFVKRRSDGVPAILRVTHDYTAEDALEEAKMLQRLDHPGIPKVYASFEKDGRHYMIRQYIEGRSLDRIIQAKGTIMMKVNRIRMK